MQCAGASHHNMCVATLLLALLLAATAASSHELDELGSLFKQQVQHLKNHTEIDLIFLVDASSSVGEDNFHSELGFVKKLLSDLTVSSNDTGVALITFGSAGNVITHVDSVSADGPDKDLDKCTLLRERLAGVRYTGGGTYTYGAFERALRVMKGVRRAGSRRALFLITDGFSNGGDPTPLAAQLKAPPHNVTVFSIGIKTGRSDELATLASHNNTCYLLPDFQHFQALARRALHADLQDGAYVPVSLDKCGGKCDAHAQCTCGTGSGQYACRCVRGYYGTGDQCAPCPPGTWYRSRDRVCLACPDRQHTSEAGGTFSPVQCRCVSGWVADGDHCRALRCPELPPPQHGYFVGAPRRSGRCGNHLHNACGMRCHVGYTLTGNSIRLCQADGQWSGVQPRCEVKTCPRPPVPAHGRLIECVNRELDMRHEGGRVPAAMPVDTECSFGCSQGHSLGGSSLRTCLPVAQWDGLRPTCRPVRCARLGQVTGGSWEPHTCTTERQKHGARCQLLCHTGYVPDNEQPLVCGGPSHTDAKLPTGRGGGTWSSGTSRCVDIEPPMILCPKKQIRVEAAKGSRYAVAHWPVPNVTDNSALEVTVWTEPLEEDGHEWNEFEIGVTLVTYHAEDASGNVASCNMTVEVVDTEPPVIDNCVSPPPFLTADPASAHVQWDEPLAYDNSQEPVDMLCSHEFGVFEVGSTEVTYTFTDAYNNSAECVLNITVVGEASCEHAPTGSERCLESPDGEVTCALTCPDGYGFALTDQAVCTSDTPGVWYVPECTPVLVPDEEWHVLHADTSCQDNTTYYQLGNLVSGDDDGVVLATGCERVRRSIGEDRQRRRFELRLKNKEKLLEVANRTGLNFTISSNVTCPVGSILGVLGTKCVLCPRGTYYSTEHCKPCPVDTYSNKAGQMECTSCPAGRSTRGKQRAKGLRACRALCPPGTDPAKRGTTCQGRARKRAPCKDDKACQNGGSCVAVGARRRCSCAPGWLGARCKVRTRVPCPCLHGGTCNKQKGSQQGGNQQCLCPTGFSGPVCDLQLPIPEEPDQETEPEPEPVSPCRLVPGLCENNGTCIETEFSGFSCQCVNGYIGRRCNILPCDYNPCEGNTVCENLLWLNSTRDSYKCGCETGRRDPPECSVILDVCSSGPCENGGSCQANETTGYSCQCRLGYSGERCETEILPDYVLHFPRSGVNDYVIVDGPDINLSAISVCVWLRTNDQGNYGTVLSYATPSHDNAFTITDYSGLVLYVNGQHVVTDVRLNDDVWHHLCVTWTSTDGSYHIYVDSKLEKNGSALSTGTNISGNGKLVLGQEQDALGGKFSRAESFVGRLSNVDVWSRALTAEEVSVALGTCGSRGDVRSWPHFRLHSRGLVTHENTTFCKRCDPPEAVPNGRYELTDEGRTAVYSCDTGYVLEDGDESRRCTAATHWSGSEPQCARARCPHPAYVTHARRSPPPPPQGYRLGDQVRYVCAPGLQPQQPQVRTCVAGGLWEGPRALCRGAHCEPFPRPKHATVAVTSGHVYDDHYDDIALFEVDTQLEITCHNDTQLVGEPVLSCLENGTWDHAVPMCEAAGCLALEMPSVPANGYTLDDISGVSFRPGTVVTFKCRTGYRPTTTNSTRCLPDGSWSPLNITCHPVECVPPPIHEHMTYKNGLNISSYHFGNMLKYECAEGHQFYGNNVIRCLANGKWTKLKGQCTRISCNKPEVSEGETVLGESYLFGDSLTVQCPLHAPRPQYHMRCAAAGHWLRLGDCHTPPPEHTHH